MILREKEFRQALKEVDWNSFADKGFCIYCSTDAIIPVWAYMLVATYVGNICSFFHVGSLEDYIESYYDQVLSQHDFAAYADKSVVIKGCSNKQVPESAYAKATKHMLSYAKSIMYGEPCSTVPIYKRK